MFPTGEKKDIERDCALSLSQNPAGEVIVIFYPFRSELRKPHKEYYVYKIYSGPEKISKKELQFLIRILFSFARYSTFSPYVNFYDRWLIFRLKFRTIITELLNRDLFDFAISIAMIFIKKFL